MDIEEVASKTPEKIITTKVDINNEISEKDCLKIVKIFNLNDNYKNTSNIFNKINLSNVYKHRCKHGRG
jgi:succinyl-CoA synthetase beta subunit